MLSSVRVISSGRYVPVCGLGQHRLDQRRKGFDVGDRTNFGTVSMFAQLMINATCLIVEAVQLACLTDQVWTVNDIGGRLAVAWRRRWSAKIPTMSSTNIGTMPAPSFGQELPDQLPRVQSLVSEHIAFLLDIREYFKERVALERQYGTGLQAIVRKAAEKRCRKEQALSVGLEPSKAWGGAGSGGSR